MTQQQLNLLAVAGLAACWGAFVLTWLAGAIYNQYRAPAAELSSTWFPRSGWIIVAVAWAAVPRAGWNSLGLHPPPWIRILGLAILLAATAFTLWARFALGTMWSGAPTVKQQHQLRTSGPYGVTRHPIYTGMLGMMLGSLLLAGGGRWILPFPVFLVLSTGRLVRPPCYRTPGLRTRSGKAGDPGGAA